MHGNFTEFRAYVQLGTKIYSFNFEVRSSNFKVMLRLPMVRNYLLKNAPFWHRHIGQQFVIEDHMIRFWQHLMLTFDGGSCFSILI